MTELVPSAAPSPGRRVHVSVGIDRAALPVGVSPPVCILGIAPPGAPWYAEIWPSSVVRTTRFRTRQGAVEQLAFRGGEDLGPLPGLDPRAPSRVRDAVRLALAAGAPVVAVLLARGDALERPWMLDEPDLQALTAPFLDTMQGTILVLPDAGGPVSLSPLPGEDPASRVARLRRTLHAHAPGVAERYQVGLVDDAPDDDDTALPPFEGVDFALCRWMGSAPRLSTHGWRCAAAAVAGALARVEPYQTLSGARIPLGPGRRVEGGRDQDLGAPRRASGGGEQALLVHLDETRDEGRVDEEPVMRRPLGTWTLPGLRTVKAIHLTILRTAERFTFVRLEETEALSLSLALNLALRPFVQQGLLTGPDGTGGPLIDGEVLRDPAAPSLLATLNGQLRPWCQAIEIRLIVSGAQPILETRG